MINKYLKIVVVMLFLFVFVNVNEYNYVYNNDVIFLELIVYKIFNCGCCKKWIIYIEDKGNVVYFKDFWNIGNIKIKYGIKFNYCLCYMVVSRNGFVFEGYIFVKFI